jgi:hypothetical protein
LPSSFRKMRNEVGLVPARADGAHETDGCDAIGKRERAGKSRWAAARITKHGKAVESQPVCQFLDVSRVIEVCAAGVRISKAVSRAIWKEKPYTRSTRRLVPVVGQAA